jgi:hypothetical protein
VLRRKLFGRNFEFVKWTHGRRREDIVADAADVDALDVLVLPRRVHQDHVEALLAAAEVSEVFKFANWTPDNKKIGPFLFTKVFS